MIPISLAAVEKRHIPLGIGPWTECLACHVPYPCETARMSRAIRTVLELPEREWNERDANSDVAHARGYNYALSVVQRTLAAFVSVAE